MTVREILLESSQQRYPRIVELVPKRFRLDSLEKHLAELDVPRRPNSARRLSELQHVPLMCNLLEPDYVIYDDANSWIQGHRRLDDPHHLSAQSEVQFNQHLCFLLGPQSAAYLQGSSRL